MITEVQPVRIFIAYAHEDATSRERLRIHLNVLQRRGLCHIFWDGLILPGERWDDRLKDELRRANIFLLLVSEHFLDSDYVHEVELPKALELQKQGKAEVLPVILRNCLWRHTELVDFQCILHRGEPIEETNGFAHVADLVAETAFQLNVKRAAEIRAQQEIADQEQAIMAAAQEARKQRLNAFESARTEADALYSKKQWQAAFEAYNLTLQLLEPDFPDTAKRLQTRLRGCEIGIGKERKQQKEKAENAAQVARERQIREQADHDLWEFVEETDTEAGYKKYLQKYPDGLHAAEARGKLDKFDRQHEEAERKKQQQAADISAWQVAEKADTESAYKKYLQQYPEGLYAVQAHRRQQALLLEAEAAVQKQRAEEEAARLAAEAKRIKEADPFADLMVHIKGGTFDMGDTFGDGEDSEQPVHRVTVKDFYLCKYPVTQAQWKQIMGENPSTFKGDDLPVETVSWDDAQKFIKKLNEKTGKKYRLPSEAEWEYAARECGKKVRFGNGKDIADPKEINFDGSKGYKKPYSVVGEFRRKTTSVTTFAPNALGLHDMSGNVREWCQDMWYDDYTDALDNGSAWKKGGDSLRRVGRGGSWYYDPGNCRAAYRNGYIPGYRLNIFGFRLAR